MSKKAARRLITLAGKVLGVARNPYLNKLRGRAWSHEEYHDYMAKTEPKLPTSRVPTTGPLISIVVPAFNTPDKYFAPMIDSVVAQTYSRWELLVVDASTDPKRSAAIEQLCPNDNRVKLIKLGKNFGIAGNTNAGIKQAKGEFIAFLDHDDTLAEFALSEVVAALKKDPSIDLFYSDEDKLNEAGTERLIPLFKPGWSPFLFYTVNYLAHFVVARKKLVDKIDGIRLGFDGAQDYDFLLRLLALDPKVHHIPLISYHWRLAQGSTASRLEEKPEADNAGKRALADYFKARKVETEILGVKNQPTNYRPKFNLKTGTVVHLVKGAQDIPSTLGKNDIVVYCDPNLKPDSDDWQTELASVAALPEVGVVGGWITSRGRSVEQGYVYDQGALRPVFNKLLPNQWTNLGSSSWPREFVAVSQKCFAVKAFLLRSPEEVLDPAALCLRLFKAGHRNVFWPYAQMESASNNVSKLSTTQKITDPYMNPNVEIKAGLPHTKS